MVSIPNWFLRIRFCLEATDVADDDDDDDPLFSSNPKAEGGSNRQPGPRVTLRNKNNEINIFCGFFLFLRLQNQETIWFVVK